MMARLKCSQARGREVLLAVLKARAHSANITTCHCRTRPFWRQCQQRNLEVLGGTGGRGLLHEHTNARVKQSSTRVPLTA
jgi:hypothetical protein